MHPDEALRVLGVGPSATPHEIKVAYRRMVKAWHPDRHGAGEGRRARAEEALKRVIEAYQCLRDGVPPLDPQEDTRDTSQTSASMFSIHHTAPPSGRSRARSHSTKAGRVRLRRGAQTAVGLLAIVTMGVLVAALAAWSMAEPASEERHGFPPPATVYYSWYPIPVEAQRIGRDWRVQNFGGDFQDCRATVRGKLYRIAVFRRGETLVLRADDFDPKLSELDDDTMLKIICRR